MPPVSAPSASFSSGSLFGRLVVLGARPGSRLTCRTHPELEKLVVPGGHSVLWDDFDATAEAIEAFVSLSST
jgi:hypothetical protein